MHIPTVELIAQICILSKNISNPRASRKEVKQKLYNMFEPFLGNKTAYMIERLILETKALNLIKEEGSQLVAIIKPKFKYWGTNDKNIS